MRPDVRRRVEEAMAASGAAELAVAAGDVEAAVPHYREAERRLRALVEDDPDEPAHVHALGSTLYSAGEVHLARRDAAEAVEVLGRAHDAYAALARFPDAPDGVALWIADVQLRRARALLRQDRLASALAEAQAGTVAYLSRWPGTADHGLALDAARALAWQAFVTSRAGDPDIAVGAADRAIRVYLARVDDVNESSDDRAVHVPMFVLAAQVAAVVHEAHDRPDLAAAAVDMGSLPVAAAVAVDELPTVPEIRASVTLEDALARAGAPDLHETLTAPATECRILVPIERCAPDVAPAHARRLGRLAERVLDDDLAAGLRLSLEAHALFAAASEARVLSMRYEFATWGAAWADTTRRAAQACHAAGRTELALDLTQWMSGAVHMLEPHVIADPQVRATARRCITWHGQLMGATGDEDGARAALDGLRTLDTLDATTDPANGAERE